MVQHTESFFVSNKNRVWCSTKSVSGFK